MTKLDLVQRALNELGDVSSSEIGDYLVRRFGVTIEAPVVHIIRATLRHKAMLQRYREETQGVLRLARQG